MSVSNDVIKDLTISAMQEKYGIPFGKAYGLLMFGGFGIPGLIDAAALAASANAHIAENLTEDLAIELVSDAAKAGLQSSLEATASPALEAAGLSAEVVARAANFIITGIFTPSPVAPDDTRPVDLDFMYDSLFTYIKDRSNTPLKESEVELIKAALVPRKIRKKQYFLQAGEVCNHMAFIVKGAMRQFRVDDKGNEHCMRFFLETWWAGDRESYTMFLPSFYSIDAWEETDVLAITHCDHERLNCVPAWMEMRARLEVNHSIASQKRLNASISLTAEQRYFELQRQYPEFLQRFPQHQIASYLGMTKETLSRLRKQIVRNKSWVPMQ
jgi:CRP-like cAMP-binding protein